MLINAGKLLMVFVWGFMIFNLIHPFPKPLKYFIDVAMIFMIFMHAMQAIFLQAAFAKTEKHPRWLQIKIFIFGVFELLAWQKRQKTDKLQQ
ncbi:MAG TPA: DUF1145 family protein [Arsenophonus nasoniae]|uniref:DUF1145 family protein n=1 Tax=Arsenophonus nasoniae TaxID=638 RepID=A0AA95GGV0_9GAMM|nr:DUF1145 family protein [Arsenophonus nasoniae]WGL95704.1 DUF1145 family protein [Arsenophonus nasoniae]